MKTAVEWLYDRFLFAGYAIPAEWKKQAKEMEKDQLIKAYNDGYKACDLDEALEINKTMFNGEKYYIDNYKPETI